MLNKTCYIIEQNDEDLEILLSYIQKIPYLNVVGVAKDYSEGISFLLINKVDVLFMNVCDLCGNEAFEILRNIRSLPPTIITSKELSCVVDIFNIDIPVDFLLKPFDFKRFMLSVNRAISGGESSPFEKKTQKYFFKVGRKFERVNLDDVLYFQAYGVYSKVFKEVNKRPLIINETISNIENTLARSSFVRVQKSYIVNLDIVSSFDGKFIYIGNFPIPIGGAYKPQLESHLRTLIKNHDEVSI